ncbi:MAG: DUF459 domain-containing protein [bacterium]
MVEREQENADGGRLGAGPGRVLWVIAVALFIALMLNASELEKEAKAKPYGHSRDIWVAIWKPFAVVSKTLYIDRPRAWFDDAIGRGDDGSIFQLPANSDGATEVPGSSTPDATTGGSKTPGATATPLKPKQLIRTPTAEEPLRVWVGGDSISKILGEALVRQASESGVMAPVQDSQLSSGLTRPDFFDWPGHFSDLVKATPTNEVFVVIFGANDSQGIKTPDGKIFQPGDEGWNVEYRRRVAGTMDLLKADNRLVVWVGQPIMESAKLSQRMFELNGIFQEEAAKRPWVRYFDMWPLFTTAAGTYDAYITDDDGELKLMRNPDGVHLVREGGEKAARHIMELIKKEALIP